MEIYQSESSSGNGADLTEELHVFVVLLLFQGMRLPASFVVVVLLLDHGVFKKGLKKGFSNLRNQSGCWLGVGWDWHRTRCRFI